MLQHNADVSAADSNAVGSISQSGVYTARSDLQLDGTPYSGGSRVYASDGALGSGDTNRYWLLGETAEPPNHPDSVRVPRLYYMDDTKMQSNNDWVYFTTLHLHDSFLGLRGLNWVYANGGDAEGPLEGPWQWCPDFLPPPKPNLIW